MKKFISFAGLPSISLVLSVVGSPALAQQACVTSDGSVSGVYGDATGTRSLACGDGASATGELSTAIGQDVVARNTYDIAIGYNSGAESGSDIAIGMYAWAWGNASIALGRDTNAAGPASIAIGLGADAWEANAVSIGFGAVANWNSIALGAHAYNMGFVNSIALGTGTQNTADNQVSVGGRTVSGVVGGVIIAGSSEAVNGDQIASILTTQNARDDAQDAAILNLQANLGAPSGSASASDPRIANAENAIGDLQSENASQQAAIDALNANTANSAYMDVNSTSGTAASATGSDAVAFGDAATATHNNSVALGAGSVTTAANQVNVGQRTVSGVSAGAVSAVSTEAVNGSQLYATNNRVSALETGLEAMDSRMDALELVTLGVGADLRRLNRKIDGSTALAIAMSGNAFLPGKSFNLTGNVGYYRGAVAGSLQLGAMVSPNAAFNAGLATNFNKRGGVGGRAGFSIGW